VRKKYFFVFIVVAFFFIGFILIDQNKQEIPKSEQVVDRLMNKVVSILGKKYKLQARAIKIAMPGGVINLLGFHFTIQGPLTKEELRLILVSCAQDFLSIVNSDAEIRPYLIHYPFTLNNIDITLFLVDSFKEDLDDPYIGIAGIANGKLDYLTLITTDIPKIKTRTEESYEEALNTLKTENS